MEIRVIKAKDAKALESEIKSMKAVFALHDYIYSEIQFSSCLDKEGDIVLIAFLRFSKEDD